MTHYLGQNFASGISAPLKKDFFIYLILSIHVSYQGNQGTQCQVVMLVRTKILLGHEKTGKFCLDACFFMLEVPLGAIHKLRHRNFNVHARRGYLILDQAENEDMANRG